MAYTYRTIIKILPVIFILGALSCKKQVDNVKTNDTSQGKLAFIYGNQVRIDQACIIYDSLFIKDSTDFFFPPGGRLYEWKTIPDNGCGSLTGYYKNGLPTFIFHCAGTYGVTATIYDSLTKEQIGHTDTVYLTVSTEILQPFQAIQSDDTLTVAPWVIKGYPHATAVSLGPAEPYIRLTMATSKLYDYSYPYTTFDVTTTSSAGNYSFVFNKIILPSYPFAIGGGNNKWVYGTIELKDLHPGTPAGISITWLGKTYTGSITLVNNTQYSLSWINSGAVIFAN
jgi:hypothetical protein